MALKLYKSNLGCRIKERGGGGMLTNTGFYGITFEIGVYLLVERNKLPILVFCNYLCGWRGRAEKFDECVFVGKLFPSYRLLDLQGVV